MSKRRYLVVCDGPLTGPLRRFRTREEAYLYLDSLVRQWGCGMGYDPGHPYRVLSKEEYVREVGELQGRWSLEQ